MTTDHQTADTLNIPPAADAWNSGATFEQVQAQGEAVYLSWLTAQGQHITATTDPDYLTLSSEGGPVVTVILAGPALLGQKPFTFAVIGQAAPEFRAAFNDALTLARLARSRRGDA